MLTTLVLVLLLVLVLVLMIMLMVTIDGDKSDHVDDGVDDVELMRKMTIVRQKDQASFIKNSIAVRYSWLSCVFTRVATKGSPIGLTINVINSYQQPH